jgi:4-amino-4-deoxy-L-arabinose transferase-like glycosyltransferase
MSVAPSSPPSEAPHAPAWISGPGPLASVLAVALLLRLLALFWAADLIRLPGDEGYYVEIARALFRDGHHPGSFRGPGYPFFMSLVFRLTSPDNLQAVRLAHILLSLLSIVLLHGIVRRKYGARAAFWSALGMALAPNLIHFTLFLWSETLFITLLLALVWFLVRFDERGRLRDLAFAALTLAFAALTRESILPFAPVLLAWALWRPAPWRQRLRHAAVFAACLLLPLAPWTVRNLRAHGTFVLISTCRWYPLAEGNQPADSIRAAKQWVQSGALSETAAESHWRKLALEGIAAQQPSWLLKKVLQNVPGLLTPRTQLVRFVENRWYPQYSPAKRRALLAFEVGGHVLLIGLGALALVLVRPDRLKTLVLLYIGYTFALHVVANTDTRFLVPLLPLALIYVGPLVDRGAALARSRARRAPSLGSATEHPADLH